MAAFGAVVLTAAVVIIAAALFSRSASGCAFPAPEFFLLGAAVASNLLPRLASASHLAAEDAVTVALALILFDGGMRIGWLQVQVRRRRGDVGGAWPERSPPRRWQGWRRTSCSPSGGARRSCSARRWRQRIRAVAFSVLGQRQVSGRGGVLIEGESGANDPVGSALLIAMLGATGSALDVTATIAWQSALQTAVGE